MRSWPAIALTLGLLAGSPAAARNQSENADMTPAVETADERPPRGERLVCGSAGEGCGERWLPGWGPWLSGLEPPPVDERWADRWWHAGLFVGGYSGDDLIDERVEQGDGAIGGLRLGCDFDPYWGAEIRLAAAAADVTNADPPDNLRSVDVTSADVSLVFYPWTSPRWRLLLLAGVGVAVFDFTDENGQPVDRSTTQFPVGLGLKYRHDDWVAFRFDATDNICLGKGNDLSTMHNLSVTGGVEVRFGFQRKTYWPWSLRRRSW